MEEVSPSGLRIKINFDNNLQNYVGYDKVWFYVNLNAVKCIKDLQKHVKRRFGLKGSHTSLKLFLQGFLLMPEESIAILQNEDLIVVKKSSKTIDTEQCYCNIQQVPKRDLDPPLTSRSDFEEFCTEPMKTKTHWLGSAKSISPSQSNEANSFNQLLSAQILLTENNASSVNEKKRKKKRKRRISEEKEESEALCEISLKHNGMCNLDSNLSYENIATNDTSATEVISRRTSDISLQKRKRNRHRKRKCELLQSTEPIANYQDDTHKINKSVFVVGTAAAEKNPSSKPRQHIRFDNDENEPCAMSNKVNKNIHEKFNTPEILVSDNRINHFDVTSPNGFHRDKQYSKFEKKNFVRKTSIDNNMMVTDCIDGGNESGKEDEFETLQPHKDENTLEEKPSSELQEFQQPENYDLCSSLEGPPRIGDKIAFKELVLSENYSPEVSTYRVGIVRAYDPKSQDLEIELSEAVIMNKPNGKFEVDEEDEETRIEKMLINLTALVSPKLLGLKSS